MSAQDKAAPLYEHKYLYTKDLSRECLRNLNRVVNRSVRILMAIAALLVLLTSVYLAASALYFYAAALALLDALLLYRLFLHDRRIADLQYRRALAAWDSDIAQSLSFFEHSYELRTASSRKERSYDALSYAIETKNLYILVSGKTGVPVYKNGLMDGSKAEFAAFLGERTRVRRAPGFL